MAVTGFWPVYGNLKATLDYADNPDKTTPKEYLDKDLYSALRYAETIIRPTAKCMSAVSTAQSKTPILR